MKAVLTIAGSDSCGGAGIQADLKTFIEFNMYGTSAVTAVTAQNTCGVQNVHFLTPAFVGEQIKSIASDINIKSVKLGMLGGEQIVHEVVKKLNQYHLYKNLVVDPVMVSARGDILLESGAIDTYKKQLIPLASILTPNLKEASLLVEREVKTIDQMEDAARMLHEMGAGLVLLKGGDGNDKEIIDVLYDGEFYYCKSKRIDSNFHGAGCTLSSAVAACLACGKTPVEASQAAIKHVQNKIKNSYSPGKGCPVLG
ncbi:MAG: bifunctional hydroxymethylpyrimidine kinase/phosphomethylpyrimidine kinase [Clostridiales bacterium]|nr:bifunctional hydroxymethylpyrimidine kinase/phosphomethylpyrimidine kinase [Clostridiales bacterium]MCF8021392.1 bifunctional hydroxymethylpyrimidine kinase/phosphomethylpyrimidine kinase [Clostridiales bacterium]